MFKYGIDTAAAGAFVQSILQFGQRLRLAGDDDLDVPIGRVAHPAAKVKLGGLAMDKPAEADSLDATFDEKVEDHKTQVSQSDEDHARAGGMDG
jgi:hypothetical protein